MLYLADKHTLHTIVEADCSATMRIEAGKAECHGTVNPKLL